MWNNTLCQIIEKGRWIIPTQLQLSLIWSTSYKLISASTNKHEQWEETKFCLSCWKSPTVISGGNKQTNQKTANVSGQLKPVQGQCRGKSLKIKHCHKSMYINPWETTSTVRMQLLHSLHWQVAAPGVSQQAGPTLRSKFVTTALQRIHGEHLCMPPSRLTLLHWTARLPRTFPQMRGTIRCSRKGWTWLLGTWFSG